MAPLKVLIIGGGITGPALAHWLSQLPQRPTITIVERAPDLRASGQQIDIRGQGLTCLRRMGLEPAVRAKLVDEQGVQVVDEQGALWALFEANKTGRGKQSMTAEFEIMRGDLVRILHDGTKDTCRYVFGVTVEGWEELGDGVRVRFSDGRVEAFDLVVGADGQGSRTRRTMLGASSAEEGADPFQFLKLYLSYYTVPRTEKDENYMRVLLLPHRRVAMTRVDNPKTMQVYLGIMDPNSELGHLEAALQAGDMEKQKEIYCDLFKDAGGEVPRVLDGLKHAPEAKDFYSQKIGQVKMDKPWSKGRVVLLGDAAYCPSPVSGVGTSLGLIGAYVLAGELAKQLQQQSSSGGGAAKDHGCTVDAALEGYERVLRPFVEQAQKLPPGVPGIGYAETAWGVWLRYVIVSLVSKLRIHKLVERFSSDDFGGKWKLPDYPELKYDLANGKGDRLA